ncbi:unnamed protein product [Clonostachys byssicola]|uniref:Mannan endo-1,6-alpha-mannosidase n=1 Tax=Clonostachys byssicola TaxID=160290 RepID=A0A9N9USH4_9HYPO|nr:unnamed protein product [Clonostachys byssicola]
MRLAQALPATVVASSAAQGVVAPKDLDITSAYSVRNVAATIVHDAMTYYTGNTSSVPNEVGDLHDPYYWWVAGALWGSLLDYYHYTKDPTYNDVVIQALLAPTNIGPNFDYMPAEHAFEEGNDDLYFWGSAALAAAERNFPQPDAAIPSWLEIGANVFNSLQGRWNMTHCGGGLNWQIFADNPNGMNYKNSVSNGGFFQLAARLARATGNATYLEWAEKAWDWSFDIGFIDPESYHVYDGTDSANNCSDVNKISYTYTSGIYLHGAAVLANHTNDAKWAERTTKLLDGAKWFFGPYENATDIMYEGACETVEKCNADMDTHKAFLSRNMWQATTMQASLQPEVERLLGASAKAAALSCSGGDSGTICGRKWYVGGYDGAPGLGQQMTALETIQGWLIHEAAPPLSGDAIQVVRDTNWTPVDPYRPDSA